MNKNLIVVGTHHKTGTVWLLDIFKEISKQFGLIMHYGNQGEMKANVDIFFQDHSEIYFSDLIARFPSKHIKGIHIIRDPRDVVISAAFHHMKADEPWLHKPSLRFLGLTYQQKINSLKTQTDQFIFEMNNSSKHTIHSMINWNYTNPMVYELRYESLILDTSLTIFTKIFEHLGFSGNDKNKFLQIAYDNSLFSGNVINPSHVRSGSPFQWKTTFNAAVAREFSLKFNNVAFQLGY